MRFLRSNAILAALGGAALGVVAMLVLQPGHRTVFIDSDQHLVGDVALMRVIPAFDVDAMPFQDAAKILASQIGLAMQLHSEAFENTFDPDWKVTLHLKNVTAAAALDHLLRAGEGSGQYLRLVYWQAAGGGSIQIGTDAEQMQASADTRIYDVRALIAEYERLSRRFPYQNELPSGLLGDSGAGPRSLASGQLRIAPGTISQVESLEALRDLIEENIVPESWKANGGRMGQIMFWGGHLIIQQSPAVHDRIAALLDQLAANVAHDPAIGHVPHATTLPK